MWKFLHLLTSVLASHLAHPSVPKRSSKEIGLIVAQALRGADGQNKNAKDSLQHQETTWSLNQSARASLSVENYALFLFSPSLGFISVAQEIQGREQEVCPGAELLYSWWVAPWHLDSCMNVPGSPLVKMGTKTWWNALVSGKQLDSQHPLHFLFISDSTQWKMTSLYPPFFLPALLRIGNRNVN